MKGVLVNLVVVCIILCNDTIVDAEPDGLQRIVLAIAKGKEILDRGIKLQSERQDSVDFFGTKVDTSYSTKQGFGDAVKEGATDSFEDDLERKKRAVDVLEYLRTQGLFTNSASGTNVNIVKISSVSNVNNYGPAPTEATTVASRRKRSMKYVAADETISVMTSEDEMKPDGSFKGNSVGQIHEAHMKKMMLGLDDTDGKKSKRLAPVLYKSWDEKVTGFRSESRMKPGGTMKTNMISESDDTSNRGVVVGAKSADELDDEVPMRYERSLEEVRSKRSPQEIEEGATSTEKPRCGGRGKGGPGGRGGKRGEGRGRGPPPPPEDGDAEDTDDERAKREIKQSSQNDIADNSVSSSAKSSSSSNTKSAPQSTTDSGSESGSDSDESGSESDSDSNESGSGSDSDYDSDDSGSDSDSSSSEDSASENITEVVVSGRSTTPTPPPPSSGVVRSKRSPCWGRRQQVTTTTVAAARMKRQVPTPTSVEEFDEEQQKMHSWFHTVVETIVESAKRVSAAVRRVFGRGEGNPDVESVDGTGNPKAETLE